MRSSSERPLDNRLFHKPMVVPLSCITRLRCLGSSHDPEIFPAGWDNPGSLAALGGKRVTESGASNYQHQWHPRVRSGMAKPVPGMRQLGTSLDSLDAAK